MAEWLLSRIITFIIYALYLTKERINKFIATIQKALAKKKKINHVQK